MTSRDQALALVDEARALEAQALGKRMEAAKLLGQHDEARRYMREMYAVIDARVAAAEAAGGEYFMEAGRVHGESLRGA